MSLTIRKYQIATIAIIFLLFLSIYIPALAAGDIPSPLITVPANDTSLSGIGAHGTGVPVSSLRKEDTITLFRLESNQTTFPGPRSMAFGPRYIQLTTNLPTLLLLLMAGACVAVLAFVFCRRRKARVTEGDTIENKPDNGDKKQV
jgi:cbb3-type cytochrome oxidase subunit 3